MKRILFLIVAVSLLVSCGEKLPEPEPDTIIPVLTATDPVDGITGLEGSSLTVRFNFNRDVICPDASRGKISAGEAVISQIFAPGSYVSITMTGLKAGQSYTLEIPSGCICSQENPGTYVKAISFHFSMKEEKQPPVPSEPYGAMTGIAKTLSLGWNMGNQFDAFYNGTWAGDKYNYPDETCWGNGKCTQATFDALKKAGFTSVRIPITWLNMIGPAPDYKVNKEWMDRIAEVVGYAEKAGLNCIINTHHDENNADDHWLDVLKASQDAGTDTAIRQKITALWTQIGQRFKDKGDWLIFESFNEIQDGGWGWSEAFRQAPNRQCGILNGWNQTFVDAVRAVGGNNATRWLGVPGYAASADFLNYFQLPKDNAGKVMLAVHFYDPFDYASGSKYSEWGHTADPSKKSASGDESNVTTKFKKLYDTYVKKGIPVYLGEYGCVNRSNAHDRAFQFYYMEYVTRAARLYGLPCFLWDNGAYDGDGENFGYIRHDDGSFIGEAETAIKLMVKAMFTDDPSYNLDTIYKTAPKD